MTKTTNYEISKKLAEIGFKANAEKCWAKIRHSVLSEFDLVNLDFTVPQHCDEWVLSYDLETLLDALPSEIEIENWGGWKYYNIYFKMNKNGLWYENLCNCDSSACPVEKYHYMEIIENESLADTAGRLIILLESKNLIEF
jgi:hypothetical protein